MNINRFLFAAPIPFGGTFLYRLPGLLFGPSGRLIWQLK